MSELNEKTTKITTEFGDVILGKLIGRGGFGRVYLAQLNFHDVAVKVFNTMESPSPLQQKTTLNTDPEIEILKKLNAKHIVRFYGTCYIDHSVAIVLEYADRGSLRDILKNTSVDLSWEKRWRLAEEIARGLAYLHSKDVIHRDLKSANVLLAGKLEVKLADFGLSVFKDPTTSLVQVSSAGTIRWKCAQELRQQVSTITDYKACDIYSAGMVFWEMATRNVVPFMDIKEEIAVAMAIMNGQKERVPDNVPVLFQSIITECWDDVLGKRPLAGDLIAKIQQGRPTVQQGGEKTAIKDTSDAVQSDPSIHLKGVWSTKSTATIVDTSSVLSSTKTVTMDINTPLVQKKSSEHLSEDQLLAHDAVKNLIAERDEQKRIKLRDAMYMEGLTYEFGTNGIEKNVDIARKRYYEASNLGDSESMFRLGRLHFHNAKTPQDESYQQAMSLFEKAASLKNKNAMVKLGYVYWEKGKLDQALDYFTSAQKSGVAGLMRSIVLLSRKKMKAAKAKLNEGVVATMNGDEISKENEKIIYDKLVYSEQPLALIEFGQLCETGELFPRNIQKAINLYSKAIVFGSVNASAKLGKLYYYDHDVDLDYKRAFDLFKTAADGEDPEGTYYLACCYRLGRGVSTNHQTAKMLFHKALEAGYAEAVVPLISEVFSYSPAMNDRPKFERYENPDTFLQKLKDKQIYSGILKFGECFLDGIGVFPQPPEAARMFKYVMESGNDLAPKASTDLAAYFLKKTTAPESREQARLLLVKATKDEYAPAFAQLGRMYVSDQANDEEVGLAPNLLVRAAELGETDAMIDLANMYQTGKGFPEHIRKAREWYERALALGNAAALKPLAR